MSIIRIVHDHNYFKASNECLRTKSLSFRARGIHTYLISNKDDWIISLDKLAEMSDKDGRASIRSAVHELIDKGYIRRHQKRLKNGQLMGYDYNCYETLELAKLASPACENCTTVPACEKPMSDNRTQATLYNINTNNNNNYNNNINNGQIGSKSTKPIGYKNKPTEKGGDKMSPSLRSKNVYYPEDFERLWEGCKKLYGKHTRGNKQKANNAFSKIFGDSGWFLARIQERFEKDTRWKQGIGIPHISTFINERRWEDDICTAEPASFNSVDIAAHNRQVAKDYIADKKAEEANNGHASKGE